VLVRTESKEIMGAQAQLHGPFHSLCIQLLGNGGTIEPSENIRLLAVPDPIAIGFLRSGKASVEPLRGIVQVYNADILRESVTELGQEPAPVISGTAEGGYLSCGMDTGIGPTATVDLYRLSEDIGQGGFDTALYGIFSRQPLPALKARAVIADSQAVILLSHSSISSIASALVSAVNANSPLA
jgi:hypothetical protein